MKSLVRCGLAAAFVFFLLPIASAQDRPDHGERLAEALDLSDAQAQLVTAALREAEPGTLWALAADLAPTLTAEQKDKLFVRPERPERGRRGDARGKQRGERPKRGHADRQEAHHEQMKDALGLTESQVQRLDALHAERQAEREARRAEREERLAERPAPGELPADLAAILTPEQQEVAQVHRALAARMMHHRFQRHHGAQNRRSRR